MKFFNNEAYVIIGLFALISCVQQESSIKKGYTWSKGSWKAQVSAWASRLYFGTMECYFPYLVDIIFFLQVRQWREIHGDGLFEEGGTFDGLEKESMNWLSLSLLLGEGVSRD